MKLNVEQRRIIENKPNGHILVKGVAGSGKTTVAVNKIPFLLKNYCYEKDDNVLVVTYNKSLINYVKYIYGEIEKYQDEEQLTLGLFNSNSKDKLYIKNIDSIMYRYFMLYLKQNKIEKLFKMTDFQRDEATQRFARQLRGMGVDKALREKGAKDGDTIRLLDFEFEFIE